VRKLDDVQRSPRVAPRALRDQLDDLVGRLAADLREPRRTTTAISSGGSASSSYTCVREMSAELTS
jgi:hypothetical protein